MNKYEDGISNEPLVSIITPSFNQGAFIKRTIDSVLSQSYKNIEYIVIDGGSTDETLDILRTYGNNIKWISEKDNGQSDAINKGIKMSKGQIIGWINSDDTYTPHAVEKSVQFLRAHEDVSMVYGQAFFISKDDEVLDKYPTETFSFNRLAETCYICQPSVFLRRKVFDSVGYLNTSLHLCMDYEFWIRVGKSFSIGLLNEHIANSRIYAENKTFSRRSEVFKEAIQVVKEHYKYVPLSWIYSYSKFKHASKKKFLFSTMTLFFKYNKQNLLQATYRTIILICKKLANKL